MALLAGMRTFESKWFGGQHTISHRDRYAIASHIAGDGIDVLIAHDCKRTDLIMLPRIRSVHSIRTVTDELPIDPPF
jgi:hypothetical protein